MTACWDDGRGSPVEVNVEIAAELAQGYWSEPPAFAAFIEHGSGETEEASAWPRRDDEAATEA